MRRIQKGLREVHTLSVQDRDQLARGLSSVFDVCLCAYEADPCIGCHDEENDRIVISQDSDFFAYERVCFLTEVWGLRRRQRYPSTKTAITRASGVILCHRRQ
ncbi:hypothetical protein BCR41DRAFT_347644 [Lobosporangium transversale]|uniref:DUF5615 domain-containing protein n=1 Tax=Lobosporangium transversale TaxID=64571 RepID=A0A1Y2GXX0_9FUNG|nr:hypothetical protein BCR41DRAFT_347644 [Lobosporangium transversale]ORZ26621.1 hypothetical protein BCR41DRAFT_347644 [Lobosporangium transversale]|eukprot:XP_021884384.1 hypothetical protein BCR41DRAFT_347644 [Lobosporangium transversale]